jgi:hypothetical protein
VQKGKSFRENVRIQQIEKEQTGQIDDIFGKNQKEMETYGIQEAGHSENAARERAKMRAAEHLYPPA